MKSLGTGAVKDHFYFNEDWQELEVRKETSGTISANPFEQFVWHPYYIDALTTRFYDSDVSNSTGVVQHYFTHDANFNVTAAVDTSGNVVERYDYSPYGEPIFLDANFDFDADSVSDIAHSRTYTGQRLDTETGLHQYRNRYYHARLGRFISRDPIGYEGSQWNLYEYVGSNPIFITDPSGLYPAAICEMIRSACYKSCTKKYPPNPWGGYIDWNGAKRLICMAGCDADWTVCNAGSDEAVKCYVVAGATVAITIALIEPTPIGECICGAAAGGRILVIR